MNNLIQGAVMALMSLFGLFLASRAQDAMFGFFGSMIFAFGLVAIFVIIHRSTGKPSA